MGTEVVIVADPSVRWVLCLSEAVRTAHNGSSVNRGDLISSIVNDADRTWLYLYAGDGSLQAEVRGSLAERWLYQGFHSLNLPWLSRRPGRGTR